MKKRAVRVIILLLVISATIMWIIFYILTRNNNVFDEYFDDNPYEDAVPIESIVDYEYTLAEYISFNLESHGYSVDMSQFDPDSYVHNSYNQVSYVLQSTVGDLSVIVNYDKDGNYAECIIDIIEGDPEE